MTVLPIDPDELALCVSCGLCLPHCPTFRVSGEESMSPRGRIAAMRAVEDGGEIGPAFERIINTCVTCRACETACPSSVPFGHLAEGARQALAPRMPVWQRAAYRTLRHPRLLDVLTKAGALSQRSRVLPPALARRLGLPDRLPLRNPPLEATGNDVWLFTGCVMDAWQRRVHRDAIAVLGAMGYGVALPGPAASCCGALHAHAGLRSEEKDLARRVMSAFPGDAPILVDSAGCGAQLLDYGRVLGTDEALSFAGRVYDIQAWMAASGDRLPPARPGDLRIAVQDPCHLRHVQKVHQAVRTVLAPYGTLVELTDEGRCCGAGGAYSVLQPELANRIRDQKLEVITAARADVVASANPGCAMWLAGAGLDVAHPMEIIARRAGLR